jgi:signal transduction histidine kinase
MIAEQFVTNSLQIRTTQNVAHDIRSPLTALNLLLRTDLPLNDLQRNLVLRSLDRIQAITNDLLEPIRAEEFMQEENVLNVIQEIVQETLLRQPCKIVIEKNISEERNTTIKKNKAVQLQRTISNLLNNAIEACDDPVHCMILLKIFIYKTHFKVEISDNGRGIPMQILSQVGQRGFTYQKPNGHGLGLAQAKEFIEGCGGTLQLRANENHGTNVSFFLPF